MRGRILGLAKTTLVEPKECGIDRQKDASVHWTEALKSWTSGLHGPCPCRRTHVGKLGSLHHVLSRIRVAASLRGDLVLV